jgi:HemY protein
MTRLIIYLIILVLAIWAGLEIIGDPGYVLFSFHQWTMELPLWLCILVVLIIIWLVHYLWRLFYNIFHPYGRLRSWHSQRSLRKSHSVTGEGLLSLSQGHYRRAEKLLIIGVKKSKTPLVNYLAAARAAHEQGSYHTRDKYLKMAHQVAPKEKLAIGLTQAELQLQQKQTEPAIALLKHLYEIHPKNLLILQLLKEAYLETQDWLNLLKLSPILKQQKLISEEDFEDLQEKIYHEKLLQKDIDGTQLRKWWADIPVALKQRKLFVTLYIKALLRLHLDDEAMQTAIQYLKKEWDEDVILLFAQAKTSRIDQQIKLAEQFFIQHKNSPALMLALAKLCIRQKSWEQAKELLQTLISKKPSANAYILLGFVFQKMDDKLRALEAYQQGVNLKEDSL